MPKCRISWRPLAAVASVSFLAACGQEAVSQSQPSTLSSNTNRPPFATTQTALGPVLATSQGMTVYTYRDDSLGKSTCYDDCAVAWPPVIAAPGSYASGNLTLIQRDDGAMQWAIRGMPLYTYVDDRNPGDTFGEGKNDAWYVVK